MKSLNALFGFLVIVFFSTCTPYFITNNFEELTRDHKTVAVLPFKMIYTGVMPDGITGNDMEEIEIAESKAFQMSMYSEILRSTRMGKDPISVSIQDFSKTLQILSENNISIVDSWGTKPEELSKLLGVDAVVKTCVQKNRLMTDLESFGIEVAVHILDVITDHSIWPWLPHNAAKSKEIKANYSLIDSKDGKVLWNTTIYQDADWSQKANEIIDNLNRRSAKKFPYRTRL